MEPTPAPVEEISLDPDPENADATDLDWTALLTITDPEGRQVIYRLDALQIGDLMSDARELGYKAD